MALLGGGVGGAGNPVGGSFTGPAETLEIIGNHAYAYSGLFAASTSPQTTVSFTSGNYYLVGTIQLNSAVDDDNASLTNVCSLNIKLNGTSIGLISSGAEDTDVDTKSAPKSVLMNIIIPPYTEVLAIVDSTGTQADRFFSTVMTGRIYRTRD